MAKGPTISTIASGYYSTAKLNSNFTNIDNAFDNTLSLDGSTPNAMNADFDLNSNDLLNGGTINAANIVIGGTDLAAQVAAAAASAAAAATSASNAATSETNAENSYDAFDDRFLGAKASEPALDNDGNALQTGALFFDTTAGVLKVYNGAAWTVGTFDGTRFLLNDESDVIAASDAYLNLAITNSLATGYSEFRADASDGGFAGIGIGGPSVSDDGFDEAYVYTDQVALRVVNQHASGVIDFFAGGSANSNKVATITSGGLGVGVASPSNLLHLKSTFPAIRFDDTDITGRTLVSQSGAAFILNVDVDNVDASSTLRFNIDGSELFHQTATGAVRLGGGGGPAVALHIAATDAIKIPVGTTAQRPTGATGYIRYNSTEGSYEGYNGSAWGSLGGAGYFQGENGNIGTTAAKGDIFRSHEQTLNTNVTIAGTDNSLCAGPLTIATGVTLTVSSGGNLVIA